MGFHGVCWLRLSVTLQESAEHLQIHKLSDFIMALASSFKPREQDRIGCHLHVSGEQTEAQRGCSNFQSQSVVFINGTPGLLAQISLLCRFLRNLTLETHLETVFSVLCKYI